MPANLSLPAPLEGVEQVPEGAAADDALVGVAGEEGAAPGIH